MDLQRIKELDRIIAGLSSIEDLGSQALLETRKHKLQQVARRTIGRWVAQTYRRRPMIVPAIIVV